MISRKLSLFLLIATLIGCGGGGGNSGSSYLVSTNAIPNVGSLSITANGTLVLNSAAYGTASPGFVTVGSGTNALVYLTNTGGTQLASGTTSFTSGDYYSVYAVGSSANQFLFFYPLDVSTPSANTGRLIFVNASTLQPSVDIYITPQGGAQGSPQLTSLTAFNSGQEISGLSTGTYDVQFKAAGTQNVLVDEPSVVIGTTPASNEIQLVAISDSATGSALPQTGLPVIPIPAIAGAPKPLHMGQANVVGHPGMTSFPTSSLQR